MGHSRASFFFQEAVCEARQGFTSLITPIVFFGLTAYMLIFLLNAEYMRSMGAVDIYRNSPHVIYLMVSGQSLWLFFAWAWLFAQVVVRDRSAQLHEVVLASPVSLQWLIAARFTGAFVVAVFLGSSICVGLLMAPILVTFGALPPDAVGPVPWAAAAWSVVIFTIPTAFATGVLFTVGASFTRSNTGAFVVAALLSLVWMISLIALNEGGVNPLLASVIDPSAYVEAERQSHIWTPSEKKVAIIGFTEILLLNRGLWLLIGLVLGVMLLKYLRREHLVTASTTRARTSKAKFPQFRTMAAVGPIVNPNWLQVLVTECAWHLKISLQSFGLRLALFLLTALGAAASWVNSIEHIDGPLVLTPEAVLYFMVGFYFVFIVFVIVGSVGALMRRDDNDGFVEWLDISPVPLGIRLLARFFSALGLTVLLCLVPAVASLVISGLAAPLSLNLSYPFALVLLTVFPAMAEICAVVVIAHALFEREGIAYVVSILLAFIAIINHEVEIVEYAPAAFGIPIHVYPSEITGWAPWMPMVLTLVGLKLAIALLIYTGSWIAWRRGTALTFRIRLNAARRRVFSHAGILAFTAIAMVMVFASVLSSKIIDEGGYVSSADALQHDGYWERVWWAQASPFSMRGGDVIVRLNPSIGRGDIHWRIDDLSANRLHGTLPHGISLISALRDGAGVNFTIDGDHFVVEADCETPCMLSLKLIIETQGWQSEASPWLDASGVWLRAENVLPTLGHDPERLVRSIVDRARLELPAKLPALPAAAALRTLNGVAPLGDWSWSVAIDQGSGDYEVTDRGNAVGVLAFASTWFPEVLSEQQRLSTRFLIGNARLSLLDGFAEDLETLRHCVDQELGAAPSIDTVVQAPRKSGDIAVYSSVLWAPEDIAWQSDGTGGGSWQRQYKIAAAMARDVISARSDLRNEAGAKWFLEGTAGWTALRCVEVNSGFEAAIALRKRAAETLAEVFATFDKPITRVADADVAWIGLYAMLSLDSLGAATGLSPDDMLAVLNNNDILSNGLLPKLKTLIEPDSLNELLGPPISSDVTVANVGNDFKTTVSSWVWQAGGWHKRKSKDRLIIRGPDLPATKYSPESTVAIGTKLDGTYLFYEGLGYERTIEDNRLQDD